MFNLVLDSYSLVGHVLFTACFSTAKVQKRIAVYNKSRQISLKICKINIYVFRGHQKT